MLDKGAVHNRILELREILWENSRRYYVDNDPVISDYEYDSLMHELEKLEEEFPEFISPDSPTRKVGSDLEDQAARERGGHNNRNAEPLAGKEFVQYPHRYPMLSLANTYNIAEIEEFVARASKSVDTPFSYSLELKFDGTAICLNYLHGRLLRALTRGDGVVGDDVTANVLRIAGIPHQLKGNSYPDDFEIRGEILMPYSSFEELNRQRLAAGEQAFANPRNAASGSLKLLDPDEVARRGLICTLYHIPSRDSAFKTHADALDAAASWGLPVSSERRICRNITEIEQYINHWDSARKELPYPTDGIVIKINEFEVQDRLGFTSKSPRWATAFKFKAEDAVTQIQSIDYQVGRTGAVTPVANLAPVLLSGTVVKRATLNNAEQMSLLDIRIGDYVHVEKGGEIIPKITRVEMSRRLPDAPRPVFPSECPVCGSLLVRPEGEARHFCSNSFGCPMQIQGRLLHFLSRKAMNVIAGEATVAQMYEKGLVRYPSDFYRLELEDLLQLEGWKGKMASRFLDSLRESAAKTSFEKVLFALGIRYVGETTAKVIARHFGSMKAVAGATKEELLAVEDVGEVVAGSILDFFGDENNRREIERLADAGLAMELDRSADPASVPGVLDGKSIVISGTFSISRDEMKALIERYGGRNVSALSSRTDYLLAGTKPGPEKMDKARALGIAVIDEDGFYSLLGRSEPNLFSGMI